MQQDGAPAHTARTTTKQEHINFIEPHMWPPNSPDINPVDNYAIWGALQQRVYHQRAATIQDGGITAASDSHRVEKNSQRFIDNSINE